MKKYVIISSFILLYLTLLPSKCERNSNKTSILCPPNLSIAISDGNYAILSNSSLLDKKTNVVYPNNTYYWDDDQTMRVCVCMIESKPCIRKCCNSGEILLRNLSKNNQCSLDEVSDSNHLKLDEARISSDMRIQLNERPYLDSWFTVLPSSNCSDNYEKILLNPDEYPDDAYTLYENGSMWLSSTGLLSIGRFCMDKKIGYDKLAVFACIATESYDDTAPTIVRVGYFLSVPFLAVTLFVYGIIPELRNIYGKTLMCYVAALLAAYTSISVSNFFFYGIMCHVTAYIVHFSFLASFFWLNVMCFDIWWTFGGFRSLHGSVKQRERKKFIMYSIYAWSCSSILTIVCMIMDLAPGIPEGAIRPGFGKGSCWFSNTWARALYFYGPMGLTVLCNICLFILTAVKILRHKKDTARQLKGSESRRHDDNKQWFNLYLKLFIVMGINWSMEIISWLFADTLPKYVWYLTDLTNTLQGVIIFIIFVWKDKIKRLLLKRFGCQGNNFLSRNSTSRSGPTSSASRTTCVTAAPLQEKVNPYADSYRPKNNTTVTDESDCI